MAANPDGDRRQFWVSKGEEKVILRWRSLRGDGPSVLMLAVDRRGEPLGLSVFPLEGVGDLAALREMVASASGVGAES